MAVCPDGIMEGLMANPSQTFMLHSEDQADDLKVPYDTLDLNDDSQNDSNTSVDPMMKTIAYNTERIVEMSFENQTTLEASVQYFKNIEKAKTIMKILVEATGPYYPNEFSVKHNEKLGFMCYYMSDPDPTLHPCYVLPEFYKTYLQDLKVPKGLIHPKRIRELQMASLETPTTLDEVCKNIKGIYGVRSLALAKILTAQGLLPNPLMFRKSLNDLQLLMLYLVGYPELQAPMSTREFIGDVIIKSNEAIDICSYKRIKPYINFCSFPLVAELNQIMPLKHSDRDIIENNFIPKKWKKAWGILHRITNIPSLDRLGSRIVFNNQDAKHCLGPKIVDTVKALLKPYTKRNKYPRGIRNVFWEIYEDEKDAALLGQNVSNNLMSNQPLIYENKPDQPEKFVECFVCENRFATKHNSLGEFLDDGK